MGGYSMLCTNCGERVCMADYYCRWCGAQLRERGEY